MSENSARSYSYDDLFYDYQREGSARSAREVLPLVVDVFGIKNVLDVGCGAGAWLSEYRKLGISDHVGVDGDYVNPAVLLIDVAHFVGRDIAKPFDLGRSFDLVQCLEVAEHVPNASSGVLVDNIVRHGKRVLFSAAVPGQGGENHINEQPYEFWRKLFRERGYRLFDFVRPAILERREIEPWYRYNILFFAHESVCSELPPQVTACAVPDGASIKDVAPAAYRLRKAVMRLLPSTAVSGLAVVKHKLAVLSLKRR